MTKTINPSSLSLTSLQLQAYRAIEVRENAGLVTTRAAIQEILDGRERSWVSRNLAVLVEKGLIELYAKSYYRLTN